MNNPRTFQELGTKTHGMEMTIANRCVKLSISYELKKDKGEIKKSSKPLTELVKESMATSTEEPVQISGKFRPKKRKDRPRGMTEGSDLC